MDNESNNDPTDMNHDRTIGNVETPEVHDPEVIGEHEIEKPIEERPRPIFSSEQAKPADQTNTKPKKTILFVIILALVLIVCYLIYMLAGQKVGYRADVSFVSGKIEKSENATTWVALKSGDDIKQGELVRVNGEGKAILALDDGSAIRLNGNSRIKLVSLDPKNIQISNEAGEVYTRVVKLDRPFIVKVDKELYRAMGTAYKTVNEDEQKGVFVYESTVKAMQKNTEITQGKKLFEENKSDLENVGKVVDITDEEMTSDEFLQWNIDQDSKDKDFKNNMGVLKPAEISTNTTETTNTEEQKSEEATNNSTSNQATTASIYLSGSASSTGVNLYWTVTGLDAPKGFKVVKGAATNPAFPGNDYQYLSSGESRSYSWAITDGVTYHFRVCQYLGGSCGVYSNDITVTAPKTTSSSGTVNSITVFPRDGYVSWEVDGYSANGFKVVWSKTSDPTYPNRSTDRYQYFSSSDKRISDPLDAFDGSGSYYVRVCEYVGGDTGCKKYSNQVTISLSE